MSMSIHGLSDFYGNIPEFALSFLRARVILRVNMMTACCNSAKL